jgi:hypothetical protein
MDKLFDLVTKLLPAPLLVGLMAIGTTYFAIYYGRGYRSYSDALNDSVFKNSAVLLAAFAVLYLINADSFRKPDRKPVLIIPFFNNDERDQFQTALSAQIEARLNVALRRSGTVLSVQSFLNDERTARQTALKYGASAAIYTPIVIKEGEKVSVCFKLLQIEPEMTKPYALIPMEVPESQLVEIVATIQGSNSTANSAQQRGGETETRLTALETELAALRTEIKAGQSSKLPEGRDAAVVQYAKRVAVIVGIDEYKSENLPPLRFAISDARSLSEVLGTLGFESTSVTGSSATRAGILTALARSAAQTTDSDLFVVYVTGLMTQNDGKGELEIIPADYASARPGIPGITILELRDIVDRAKAKHKLVILDGCYGTSGLPTPVSLGHRNATAPVFQFFVGTADGQAGMESQELHGGVFTQSLVRTLSAIRKPTMMQEVVAAVSRQMAEYSRQLGNQQTPKLVTVSGDGEIVFAKTDAAIRPHVVAAEAAKQ